MINNNDFNKTLNETTPNKYDFQNYVKPIYCHTCCLHILNTTKCYHVKTEFHKIAQHLRNITPEPIENIKQKVLEYKMVQKYIKRLFYMILHLHLINKTKMKTKSLMKTCLKELNVKVRLIKEN